MAGFAGLAHLSGVPIPEALQRRFFAEVGHNSPGCEDSYATPAQDLAMRRYHSGTFNPAPQPVSSPDGQILLFLDGEIFNEDLDLRHQAESILKAYLQEGESLFVRLNGSYAIALLEPAQKRLRLITDRTASVPIFFMREGNLFAFSYEMKPLLALLNGTPRIPAHALSNFLSSGSILEGRTLIGAISSLRPGHSITIHQGQCDVREYWAFRYAEVRDQRDPQVLEQELYHLLIKAVERQTRDDRPVAVTLSGGYDSRSILACMRRIHPDRIIQSVTWGDAEERPFSDAVIARKTANYYGTRHSFYLLDAAALPEYFRSFVLASEGRVDAAGNYPESLRVFERIRDELQVRIMIRGNEFFGARSYVERERQSWFTAFIPDLTTLPGSYQYLKPQIRKKLAEAGYEQMRRLYGELSYDDPIDRKDHLFIAQRWPGYHSSLTQLKRKILEERNPYLDNDLMEFVSRLSAKYRVWKNLYISTVRHLMPEFEQLGASRVISLVDWDARLRTDASLQNFVRHILLERRNGFDDLMERRRLELFLACAFRAKTINRRSVLFRARRRIIQRLDRYELETSLEIFRLMIMKVWADEYLKGEFVLE